MKKIITVLIFCLPLYILSQINTDDLDLANKILEIDEENILRNPLYHNWGSSIIKGKDGKYHLFYAQMSKEIGFRSWLTDGVISHAIADSPAGPYVHKEIVLEGRGPGYWDAYTAHNPRIKYFEGKYYLYYMSTNTGDRLLSDKGFDQARNGVITNEFRALVRMNQRIGVAVSKSINGPWKRLDQPIVEPSGPIAQITCNPATTTTTTTIIIRQLALLINTLHKEGEQQPTGGGGVRFKPIPPTQRHANPPTLKSAITLPLPAKLKSAITPPQPANLKSAITPPPPPHLPSKTTQSTPTHLISYLIQPQPSIKKLFTMNPTHTNHDHLISPHPTSPPS